MTPEQIIITLIRYSRIVTCSSIGAKLNNDGELPMIHYVTVRSSSRSNFKSLDCIVDDPSELLALEKNTFIIVAGIFKPSQIKECSIVTDRYISE
jgi:hypothetical protein